MTRAPEPRDVEVADIDDAVALLRASGHRVSVPARLVLEALFRAEGPVSAEYIAGGLGGDHQELDVVSVYRNLERLQELGLASHVHLGHGPGLYALVRGRPPEYLVCDRCDRVTSLDPAQLDDLRARLEARLGYRARFDHFPIHGLCPACAGRPDAHGAGRGHEHSHGNYVHAHPHDDSHGHDTA